LIESVENMVFNGFDLAEEFTDDSDAYFIINDVRGRGVLSVENRIIRIPDMSGAYTTGTRSPVRYLDVDITMKGNSFEDLRKRIEKLSEILDTGQDSVPITFADEEDRTYYGKLDSVGDKTEKARIYQATLRFLCVDPYKYGPEQTVIIPNDIIVIENTGTIESDPIFELTAKERTTFAMISNGADEDSEYNLIGTPADDDVEVVDTKTSVLYENGSTIDTWTHTTEIRMVSHDVNIDGLNGEMGTDGAGIRIENRGPTTQKQNGPAVFKELPNAIQDFEIESTFDIISRRERENWRMMIYFLDENMNNIGHMGVKDNSRNYKRRVALSQLGQHNQEVSLIGDNSYIENNARDTTLFYLRFRREGKRFTVYIAHWRNQRHETIWEASYNDVDDRFQGRLKYITLFIGRFQDRVNPNRARINSVEVFELSQSTVDQTPYIIYPGDIITFDHKDDDILINGEP